LSNKNHKIWETSQYVLRRTLTIITTNGTHDCFAIP